MGELMKDRVYEGSKREEGASICRLLLSGPLCIRIMKNKPFVLKPSLDNLFLEATWSSQQLGCGWEEFTLGVSRLFWQAVAGFPQGCHSPAHHRSNAYPRCDSNGALGHQERWCWKQPLPVIQWPAAHLQHGPRGVLLPAATWGTAKVAPPAVHVQRSPSARTEKHHQPQFKQTCINWVEFFAYWGKVSGKG